ncbi:MAG: glutamine synthetase type III [Bacteroidetes bacterium]|nr:glutamine synthetase type III [Bacteroidota bacterium]
MRNKRMIALEAFMSRKKVDTEGISGNVSDYFGIHVFGDKAMQTYLSAEAYALLNEYRNQGKKIKENLADQIAFGMKRWAMELGATHFTHWFQPMTGATAEKHQSFFTGTISGGIEKFSGSELAQKIPSNSGSPSESSRATFEARGYTEWDISSPAFIMNVGEGKTLCLPTIYIAFDGSALDYKAPLLRSNIALEKSALAVCQYFDRNVDRVIPTLGWEQEYFLVDSAMYYARPDLVVAGRTVQGRRPPKGQQLDDHYFGAIPERIYSFMRDFEIEAHKLGIPLRTRHNEVAPSQFECAPTHEDANLAIDHNLLLLDVMDRMSSKHKLKVLTHEKPFEGLNGSGKHNNWSLRTNSDRNLLSPGPTPRTNLQFLTFFLNTIAAINKYERLIWAGLTSAGNEHRLGLMEAPANIMSVYIGPHLRETLDIIEKRIDEKTFGEQENLELRLDLHNRIPQILVENTDQNRTAPIAFTGNKFEIRSVGSSSNCSSTLIILNTIVAEQLDSFKKEVDKLIKDGDYKDVAILKVLKKTYKKSKRILYEGDSYSDEWQKEAKKRKLSSVSKAPEALKELIVEDNINLFETYSVLSKEESRKRYEILLRNYSLSIQIESRVLSELALNQITPSVAAYQNKLISTITGLQNLGVKGAEKELLDLLNDVTKHINIIIPLEKKMTSLRKRAKDVMDIEKEAMIYNSEVKPIMSEIRYHCDKLEMYVEDQLWPLPKYSELLITT